MFVWIDFSVEVFLQLGRAEAGVWKLILIVDISCDVICVSQGSFLKKFGKWKIMDTCSLFCSIYSKMLSTFAG